MGFPFRRPAEPTGNWVEQLRFRGRRRHPSVFTCGVRVVAGEQRGESRRWRFRDSALETLPPPGLVVLGHGSGVTLRVGRVELLPRSAPRPGHVLLTAREAVSGAVLELSVPAGEAVEFGVEL